MWAGGWDAHVGWEPQRQRERRCCVRISRTAYTTETVEIKRTIYILQLHFACFDGETVRLTNRKF